MNLAQCVSPEWPHRIEIERAQSERLVAPRGYVPHDPVVINHEHASEPLPPAEVQKFSSRDYEDAVLDSIRHGRVRGNWRGVTFTQIVEHAREEMRDHNRLFNALHNLRRAGRVIRFGERRHYIYSITVRKAHA